MEPSRTFFEIPDYRPSPSAYYITTSESRPVGRKRVELPSVVCARIRKHHPQTPIPPVEIRRGRGL